MIYYEWVRNYPIERRFYGRKFEKEKNMTNKDKVIGNIYSTDDVYKFHFNSLNRNINNKHVLELMESIKDCGIVVMPIFVDENYNVLDGHHRLEAVSRLNDNDKNIKIKIPYVIKTDMESVKALITMNSMSKTYTTGDFINLYAKAQDGQSRKLSKIADEVGESPVTLLSVISCGSDVARNREKIKNDEFIDFDDWDIIKDFYEFLSNVSNSIHLTTKTKQMLFRVFQIDKFDTQRFIRNARNKYVQDGGEKVRFSSRQNECKMMILDLYNKGLNKNNRKYINYHQDNGDKIIIDD